ncbi:hypothetical protein AKJ16_DCAP19923, partial [Drosera capensis]
MPPLHCHFFPSTCFAYTSIYCPCCARCPWFDVAWSA